VDALTLDLHSLSAPLEQACHELERREFADALWSRRLDAWSTDPATQQKIANRLGWLDALTFVAPQVPRLRAFADGVRSAGLSQVILLGMGGSSLAPAVIHQVIGVSPGYPPFRMLDSVDPDAVRTAMAGASDALFVLASKSGSTIEPNAMAADAQRRVRAAHGGAWAERFVAITDEHSPFHRRAIDEHFREIFINPADIGGRYSALSLFGLVPAALMGVNLDAVIAQAQAMADACRQREVRQNPGLLLGACMAAGAKAGRDKLTLLMPPQLQSLGLWLEQLIAESTGKQGKGVVPITGETPLAPPGRDRLAVAITLGDELPDALALDRVRSSETPLVTIRMPDVHALGAQFFLWEVATATAGLLLGINPFDEPNVQQAKDATRVLLDGYRTDRRLPLPQPHAAKDGVRLTVSGAAEAGLAGAPVDEYLSLIGEDDYFGLLAYLPPDEEQWATPLEDFRDRVATMCGCATMFGYGPRYLHSTGQLHKGGPNNGVFIVITVAATEDLEIPGEPFSFGVLETAQAVGDFQSLDREGRRALLIDVPRRDTALLTAVTNALLNRFARRPR
jgi:transaldolase / glucose-6-phosphate isomerase